MGADDGERAKRRDGEGDGTRDGSVKCGEDQSQLKNSGLAT